LVQPRSPEVFSNRLQRAAGNLRYSAEIRVAGCGREPEIEEWLHAWRCRGARGQIGHKRYRGLVQVLAKPLVVREDECFIFFDWAACGPSELVATKRRSGRYIEVIRGVENVIAQEFIDGSMKLVATGLGNNGDLRPGALAIFRSVGV